MLVKTKRPIEEKDLSPQSQGQRKSHRFIGRHLIVSYMGCDPDALGNRGGLITTMKEAVKTAGATFLKSAEHVFSTGGLTMVALLSESHASIHTYPEHGACFVDLFTCGDSCSAEKFDAVLRNYLRPRGVHRRTLRRHQSVDDDEFLAW